MTCFLVPLDTTDAAESGLAWAGSAARRCGAALHLLTVIDGSSGVSSAEAAGAYLQAQRARLAADGLVTEAEVATGGAPETILARESGADLTVLTYGTKKWLFGGVMDLVMREASRPIVIVRPGYDDRPGEQVILAPMDRGDQAEAALDAIRTMAGWLSARVVLCHVLEPVGPYMDAAEAPPGIAAVIDGMVMEAKTTLGRVAADLAGVGIKADVVVRMGKPQAVLAAMAEEVGATLIAMATRGNHSLSRVLGSVAFAVVQSTRVPCLLVRPPTALPAVPGARTATTA